MAMPDLQRYPGNLNLNKMWKIQPFYLNHFYIASYSRECANNFRREPANKNKHFKETKALISNLFHVYYIVCVACLRVINLFLCLIFLSIN